MIASAWHAPVAWMQPTYKSLAEVWRGLKSTLHPVIARVSEQEKRIELITGGSIDMWSLEDPDGPRGRKYKRVIVNEAAMVKNLEYAWNNVIRQTLADYRGDAFFPSTPKGLNFFYSLWNMAETEPGWKRWRYPTDASPFIPADEVQAMRKLPARVVQQEIDAEFLANGSYFQNVDKAAVIEQPDEPEQHKDHQLFMGVDWALSEDYTVLTVGCRNCNKVVDWKRFNQLEFTYQREQLVSMATRWNISGCMPERNSIGEPNIEMLQGRVYVMKGIDGKPGFNTTATSKPALIQSLANALEHDGFLVPKDYADELRVYEVVLSESGHPKFGASVGHDDRVISLGLTWWAMTQNTWLIS